MPKAIDELRAALKKGSTNIKDVKYGENNNIIIIECIFDLEPPEFRSEYNIDMKNYIYNVLMKLINNFPELDLPYKIEPIEK